MIEKNNYKLVYSKFDDQQTGITISQFQAQIFLNPYLEDQ